MRISASIVVAAMCCIISATACVAGPAQECESLVNHAMALYKDKGKKALLEAIDDPKGSLVKGELYVFAFTRNNVLVAHPFQKKLRNLNLSNTIDGYGKKFVMKFSEVAKSPGQGWVEYTWAKPGEQKASPKRSYIFGIPGDDLYIGAGYYLKQ